jgi:EpsI family protein
LKRTLIVAAIFLLGAFILARTTRTEPVPIREPLSDLPRQIGLWQGRDLPAMNQRVLKVLGVDDYLDRLYDRPGLPPVALYVGYYGSQRQGDTIHSPLNCLPGAGWNPVRRGFIRIPTSVCTQDVRGATEGGILSIEVNRIVIQKAIDKQVVL